MKHGLMARPWRRSHGTGLQPHRRQHPKLTHIDKLSLKNRAFREGLFTPLIAKRPPLKPCFSLARSFPLWSDSINLQYAYQRSPGPGHHMEYADFKDFSREFALFTRKFSQEPMLRKSYTNANSRSEKLRFCLKNRLLRQTLPLSNTGSEICYDWVLLCLKSEREELAGLRKSEKRGGLITLLFKTAFHVLSYEPPQAAIVAAAIIAMTSWPKMNASGKYRSAIMSFFIFNLPLTIFDLTGINSAIAASFYSPTMKIRRLPTAMFPTATSSSITSAVLFIFPLLFICYLPCYASHYTRAGLRRH